MPTPHHKGYVRVWLGRGHPFANSGGWQYAHRLAMMEKLGRRLEPFEHVHHKNGDKASADPERLQVLHAVDHGMLHYGINFARVNGKLEHVWCGKHMTAEELR